MNILSFINYLGQRLSNQLSTPSNKFLQASQKRDSTRAPKISLWALPYNNKWMTCLWNRPKSKKKYIFVWTDFAWMVMTVNGLVKVWANYIQRELQTWTLGSKRRLSGSKTLRKVWGNTKIEKLQQTINNVQVSFISMAFSSSWSSVLKSDKTEQIRTSLKTFN